jgi:hypothetical protein
MTLFRSSLKCVVLAAMTLAAAGAQAQSSANPPAGSVGINYSRCDSNYDGWGAHLWKDPSIPLPGVEWQKPMQPSGKSDFGVYWNVKIDEFAKGKVNYIIHKGDTKEQGGRDMSFDPNAAKEIWVLNGDRKIYTSLDDAKKARAAKPCS